MQWGETEGCSASGEGTLLEEVSAIHKFGVVRRQFLDLDPLLGLIERDITGIKIRNKIKIKILEERCRFQLVC